MPRRLLSAAALAAGLTVAAPTATAVADLGLPIPQPTVSVPSPPAPSDAVPVPVEVAQSVLAPSTPAAEPAPGPEAVTADARPPKVNPESLPLPSAPAPPSLPSVPGGGEGGTGGRGQEQQQGGTGGSSPVGDDVLPAALEKELCTVLTTLLGPLPGQVRGLPGNVIGQLPRQITDAVPDDVLRTITLRCPQPVADAPRTPFLAASVTRPAAKPPARTTIGTWPAARTGTSSSLPHTGFGIALPLAGLGLLATGIWVRRRAR